MSDYETLSFEKKGVVANSTKQIDEINHYMLSYGFLRHIGIAYLGRLLLSMRSIMRDDIIDANVLSCKKSVDESMKTLEKFCTTVPEKDKNDIDIVWVLEKTKSIDVWNDVNKF